MYPLDNLAKIAAGLFVFILLCPVLASGLPAADPGIAREDLPVISRDSNVTIYFFYGNGCSHCDNVMPFMNTISQEFPNETFIRMEISENTTNRNFFDRLNSRHPVRMAAVFVLAYLRFFFLLLS